MLIGKNWKIESDSLNITLYKCHNVKATAKQPKHIYWTVEGYYSSIKNALEELVDYEVAETGLKDLNTVSQKQDKLYQLIEKLAERLHGNRDNLSQNLVPMRKLATESQNMGKTITQTKKGQEMAVLG